MKPLSLSTGSHATVSNRPHVTFVGTYPPRECGIATFTRDVRASVEAPSSVIAINESDTTYPYPAEVVATIDRNDRHAYLVAALQCNTSRTEVVCIQHEFGIFGGEYGGHLLTFLRALRAPAIVTLHTVLSNPPDAMRRVVREIGELSAGLVVLAQSARQILISDYGIPAQAIHYIPHGVPAAAHPRFAGEEKQALGLENHVVASTFGLVGPGKGIEYVIEALPEVVAREPRLLYLILGQTHPNIKREYGENYRDQLMDRVKQLGLTKNVRFVNRYLTVREIIQYLRASDIYVVPNLDPNQIASGTLAYAMGCGRAVVSTPFVYAREMLDNDRGILLKFRDPHSTAKALTHLVTNPRERMRLGDRAYAFARHMQWPEVGDQYVALCRAAINRAQRDASVVALSAALAPTPQAVLNW